MDVEQMIADASAGRVRELEGQITQARHDYYNGVPTVTDDVYDAWIDELAELRESSPAVTAVGAPATSEWPKVRHDIPMGSLEKVNTPEELTTWITSFSTKATGFSFEQLLVTEKLDGISIAVRYMDGAFVQAITRGDGQTGEDITKNVVQMTGVLARLSDNFTGTLRGEIILTKTAHAKHFPDYANTRNAASGIAKRYDGKGCEHLSVLFYKVGDGKDFEVESQHFEWLEAMGFKTPQWYVTAMAPGVKTPHDLWIDYQQETRTKLDYDIDGLVVVINNTEKQLALGEKDGRPHGSRAFKFAPVTRETILKDIVWQVGGSGRITPVAVFDPVRLLGAEVTQASLYNLKYIKDLGLSLGARILIARANDVIPRVVSVTIKSPNPLYIPVTCPVCGHNVVPEGEYLVCQNEAACPAQTVGRIKRYIAGIDVKEWGETLLERLVESGKVKTPADLYRLNIPSLSEVERISENVADKLLALLWEKTELPLETLLGSLSIPLCAASTIRMVMDAGFDTWGKIYSASAKELEGVPGLGPVKSSALWQWCQNTGEALMHDMLGSGVKIKAIKVGALTGKSVCFTGRTTRKRADLEALVTDNGGVVKTSASKGLTYLVMADPSSGSTKAKAAQKNGTTCITEDELLKMVAP